MRQLGGVRRWSAALIVVGFVLLAGLLAGCSQMKNPSYDLGSLGCGTATPDTLATIQTKVTADGTLRNGKVITVGGQSFVSAELHRRTDQPHEKGDILTWVTKDLAGDSYSSVDINARQDSDWPDADITVTAPGARESRACTATVTGKTRAQLKCETDKSNGSVPIDRDCSKL